MEIKSRKREAKRLYPRAQKWSCQTCLFLDSRKPTFELLRNCFSLPSESKNGHACRKNGCPPRVHFQATNVNAISVPSGRIVRRPTRIDTSMQSVDASCTASNNSRKLPVTVICSASQSLCRNKSANKTKDHEEVHQHHSFYFAEAKFSSMIIIVNTANTYIWHKRVIRVPKSWQVGRIRNSSFVQHLSTFQAWCSLTFFFGSSSPPTETISFFFSFQLDPRSECHELLHSRCIHGIASECLGRVETYDVEG